MTDLPLLCSKENGGLSTKKERLSFLLSTALSENIPMEE